MKGNKKNKNKGNNKMSSRNNANDRDDDDDDDNDHLDQYDRSRGGRNNLMGTMNHQSGARNDGNQKDYQTTMRIRNDKDDYASGNRNKMNKKTDINNMMGVGAYDKTTTRNNPKQRNMPDHDDEDLDWNNDRNNGDRRIKDYTLNSMGDYKNNNKNYFQN